MAEQENASSPLAEALARVGDRWTPLVVEALLGGPQRFNDLLGQIPRTPANILPERLKRPEREGGQRRDGPPPQRRFAPVWPPCPRPPSAAGRPDLQSERPGIRGPS